MEVEPDSDDWGYELVTPRIVPPTMCDSKGVIDMADETSGIKELRDAAERGRQASQELEDATKMYAELDSSKDDSSRLFGGKL